jgi:hypothetical protein
MAAAEASANAEQGSFDTLRGAGLDSAGSAKPTVAAPVASAEELARSGTVESKTTSTRESAKASAVLKRACRAADRRVKSGLPRVGELDEFLMSAAADTAAVVPKADRTADSMDVDDPAVSEAETAAAALGASVERVPSIASCGRDLGSVHHDQMASADTAPMMVDEPTEWADAHGRGASAADSAGRARPAGLRQNPSLSRAGAESVEYQRLDKDSEGEMEETGPDGAGGSRASEPACKADTGRTVAEWMQEMMAVPRRQGERRGAGGPIRRRGGRY